MPQLLKEGAGRTGLGPVGPQIAPLLLPVLFPHLRLPPSSLTSTVYSFIPRILGECRCFGPRFGAGKESMEVTSRHVPQTPGAPLQVKVTGGGSHMHQVVSRGDAGLRARETSQCDGQLG